MDKQTNIYSIFRDKLSLPEGSLDIGAKHLEHIFATLHTETYEIVEGWAGDFYCGIKLQWNYKKQWVDIAMPVYASKNLTHYNRPPTPYKPQHCPYTPNPTVYGNDN
jgi:hypothetical protein